MRRLVVGLLFAGGFAVAAPAFAQFEGAGSPANEGHGTAPGEGEPHRCTAASSDEECSEFWEDHINWWSMDYKKSDAQLPEHRHMPPPFGFALLNFAVFAGIMYRLAAKPLRDFVATRHVTIKRDLDEAKGIRQAAEAKLAEYQAKLAGLDKEVADLVATIKKDAEGEKQRIIAASEVEAQRLRKDAEAQIASEIDRLRRELRREVVDAALAQARKLVAEKATGDDQKRLAERYLASLESAKPTTTGGRA